MSGHAGRKRPRPASLGPAGAKHGGSKSSGGAGGAAKRSRVDGRAGGGLTAKEAKQRAYDRLDGDDVSIGGGSDSEGDLGLDDDSVAGSELDAATAAERAAAAAEEAETADERRLRLAKEYLKQLSTGIDTEGDGGDDDGEDDDEEGEDRSKARYDAVSATLRQEALAATGQLFRAYAATVAGSLAGDASPADRVHFVRGHRLAPTCVCISSDGKWAWTGSKDCTLLRWDVAAAGVASSAATGSSDSNRPTSGPADLRLRYPGRPKTRADVERQARLAAASKGGLAGSRPVVGAGMGGGRIGSTTEPDGALAMLSAPKIVKNAADGAQTIIVPVMKKKGGPKGAAKGAAKGEDAEEDAEDAAREAEHEARRAANAEAVLKLRRIPDYGIAGHYDEVLSVAVSSDGQFLVSGGRDKLVRVWDTGRAHNIDNFVGHREAVTGLSFRPGTHTLYSASDDRTVKQWSLDEIAYVDTLFGHQSEITAICPAGAKDRCVTVSRDRTVRLWKVPEQTQLVFRANDSDVSVDAVTAIGENWVVSGGQDGSLALWSAMKKRPVATIRQAHGDGVTPAPAAAEVFATVAAEGAGLPLPARAAAAAGLAAEAAADAAAARAEEKEEEGGAPEEEHVPGPAAPDVPPIVGVTGCAPGALSGGYCNWVTTIAHCPGTDLIATGSGDGFIRLWRLVSRLEANGGPSRQVHFTGIEAVGAIPLPGIVNGLAFAAPLVKTGGASSIGHMTPVLVAAVGQEHRAGRWWRYGSARNGLAVITLPRLAIK